MQKTQSSCPCDSGKDFASCCEPLVTLKEQAATPETLMRSRYTAFCLKNMDYVRQTTDPQVAFEIDWKANQEWSETSRFVKLEVLKSTDEGNKGTVEFKAHFIPQGSSEPQVHHELSKFRKQSGKWYFRDGKVL